VPARSLHFAGETCRSCGQVRPEGELDEHRWCPECQDRLEARVRRGKHVVALLIVLPFGAWILLLERSSFLPWYAWLIPLAGAYYLGLRIGREALKGWARWRRLQE
jgi:hypothetical protein